MASSLPSGTTPTPLPFAASLQLTPTDTCSPPTAARLPSPVFLLPVMCRTTATARPLLRPAPVAWLPWMPRSSSTTMPEHPSAHLPTNNQRNCAHNYLPQNWFPCLYAAIIVLHARRHPSETFRKQIVCPLGHFQHPNQTYGPPLCCRRNAGRSHRGGSRLQPAGHAGKPRLS